MDKRTEMTAFVGPKEWPEVPCIMKRLYSDFIVVEIPSKGNVLLPKMPECDQFENFDPENTLKRPLDDVGSEEPAAKRPKDEITEDAQNEASVPENTEATTPKMFTAEDLRKIEDVAKGVLESHTVVLKEFTKDERRLGYQYLREKYAKQLVTNCANGEVEIRRWDKESAASANPWQNDRNRTAMDRFPKGHHLFFTLTKENKDTNYAISIISKFSGMKPGMFCVAGLKDRRAITTQLVCVPNTPMSRVKRVAAKVREIYMDNFHYAPRKLQLGSLWGNHFEIVLRELDLEKAGGKDKLAERITHWSEHGFLNYFGAQRFGTCGVNTADVGRLILSRRWKEAVNCILKPRRDVHGPLAKALREYDDSGNAGRALSVLKNQCDRFRFNSKPIFDTVEGNLISTLARNCSNYKEALMKLPREMRSLYVHAYQSLVFNRILSRRCEKFGVAPLAGDLDGNGDPLPKVEDVSAEDVHLPLPSLSEKYPQNEVGEWYKEIAEADGISKESFTDLEKNFIIGDVYRPMVLKPLNVEWELITYTDDRAILQASPFVNSSMKPNEVSIKKEKSGDQAPVADDSKATERVALRIKFDLPACSYATVALRELLRTDFSKDAQKKREGIQPKNDGEVNNGAAGDATYQEVTDEAQNGQNVTAAAVEAVA